jgi:hypothetical protein
LDNICNTTIREIFLEVSIKLKQLWVSVVVFSLCNQQSPTFQYLQDILFKPVRILPFAVLSNNGSSIVAYVERFVFASFSLGHAIQNNNPP